MKRVLIIAYYWPPSGGPGVQRWLFFVKYFREFGIEPVVYIPENATYPLQDESFLKEIPATIEIISQPIKEPYRFAKWFSKKKTAQMSSGIIAKKNLSPIEKLLLYIRGNFFIPDARIGWVKPSVAYLKKYLLEHPVETVVTTGPPHSLHLIGLQLKKECKLPWVADFRDPWTTIHYHESLRLSASSRRKHKQLEASVLQQADAVTVTSATTKKQFELITPKTVHLVTNGFEPKAEITAKLDAKFSLAHIGSLLAERNPIVLWEVVSELAAEVEGFREDVEITLAGVVGDSILRSLSSFGLTANIRNLGYVSHDEAVQLQHNAQILLLLEIDSLETKVIIPGKLFEYLSAQRPIIALGPEGSDVKEIITTTESGYYFNPSQKNQLKEQLLTYYRKFQQGTLHSTSKEIESYSRKNLTQKMAQILKLY
ncbi:MAG TPA: glycosyl transferase family 1 [Flavobacteriaceae bacterium]|jgi:glycosyltransferase involved in cell wall biosynthesis|nr:glycosyl transferase family 1 [Flavobacteriaceae bacterium]HIN98522.1 glycosyl transferase family 1 [Flavobacteriaceae bacterium]|tara:strand:- start:93259 stop:94539 length:1281 start_codon:yes stop_codon:yes gene_type:complete